MCLPVGCFYGNAGLPLAAFCFQKVCEGFQANPGKVMQLTGWLKNDKNNDKNHNKGIRR